MFRSLPPLTGAMLLLTCALNGAPVFAQEVQKTTTKAPVSVPGYVITLTNQGKSVGTLTLPRDKSIRMITEADKIKSNPGTKTLTLENKAVVRMLRGDQEVLRLTADAMTIQTTE